MTRSPFHSEGERCSASGSGGVRSIQIGTESLPPIRVVNGGGGKASNPFNASPGKILNDSRGSQTLLAKVEARKC